MDRFISLQSKGQFLHLSSLISKMGTCTTFQCVQVINLVWKVIKADCLVRTLLTMEKVLRNFSRNQTNFLSRLYQLLLRIKGGVDRARLAWEKNLEETSLMGRMEKNELDRKENIYKRGNKRKLLQIAT